MIDVNLLFAILLYILGIILLLILIVLAIKAIQTLTKIDKVVDDVTEKSSKLDGMFNLVDTTTDALSSVGASIVGSIVNFISSLTNKKSKGDDKNE